MGLVGLKNERGSAVVDYLLITAVVAAVATPVLMKFFAEPLQQSFLSNRQQMVSFLAQDRKQNVPNSWFSQEDMADFNDPAVNEPAPLAEPQFNDPDEIADPQVNEPGAVDGGPEIADPQVNQPGEIADPQVNGVGPIGGGGGGGRGGNTQPTGVGGGGGGPKQPPRYGKPKPNTNTPGKTDPGGTKKAQAGKDRETISGSGGRRAAISGSDSTVSKTQQRRNRIREAMKAKRASLGGSGGKKRAKSGFLWPEDEELQDTGRSKPFDWWLLVRILIVIAIILILVVIFFSSMKRSGN